MPLSEDDFLNIHNLLCKSYGAPFPYSNLGNPLEELIGALLSHRTLNARTASAFKKLKENFENWQAIKDADTEVLVQTIYEVTFPGQKARRIQEVLRLISESNQGELSLNFLKDWPTSDAKKWLESLPGVGPKTSAAVLNFSNLKIPAMVIDSHHMRVAQRLGIIPLKVTTAKAQDLIERFIPSSWKAQDYYDHHESLMYHGQKRCFPRKPDCDNCPVKNYCKWSLE